MKNIITFSEKANELLVPAWKDYVANYRAVNFAKKDRYDTSKTLEEKQGMVDKFIEAEVLRCANISEENVVAAGYFVAGLGFAGCFADAVDLACLVGFAVVAVSVGLAVDY